MVSRTRTLLDPFEVGGASATRRASGHRLGVASAPGDGTEWFDRTGTRDETALLEELRDAPPWTPEPIDRRWRARGWDEDARG
jgi:hypothetical protein